MGSEGRHLATGRFGTLALRLQDSGVNCVLLHQTPSILLSLTLFLWGSWARCQDTRWIASDSQGAWSTLETASGPFKTLLPFRANMCCLARPCGSTDAVSDISVGDTLLCLICQHLFLLWSDSKNSYFINCHYLSKSAGVHCWNLYV